MDEWGRGDHVASDDHHRHLHSERNQRPEALSRFERELLRMLAGQYPAREHNHYGKQCEHQRVWKPTLAPIGEYQSETRQALLTLTGRQGARQLFRLFRMQRQLLHPPVIHVRYPERVLRWARQCVNPVELPRLMPRLTHHA